MILVSVFFAICDLPMNIYNMLSSTGILTSHSVTSYNVSVFVSFLYICANPFIYATKFDPVKRVLVGLIPWKRSAHPAAGEASR